MIAETAVGMPALDELLRVFLVDLHALALDVWSIVPANLIRPLVRHDARRIECAANEVYRIRDVAIPIRILNPQDKRPVICTRKQIGVQRRAQIADVHIARRTRCKAGANLRIPQRISSQTQCAFISRADSCKAHGT